MGNDEHNDTASLDLAIAFFCSVLVLFVFIAFSIVTEEPRVNVRSIAQSDDTIEMGSAGWQAIRERGDFALFHKGKLTILDMSAIARELHDPDLAYSGPLGETVFSTSARYKSVPSASALKIYVDADAPPPPWVLATVDLVEPFECVDGLRAQLTVFLLPDENDLSPLTRLDRTCDLRIRHAHVKTPEDGGHLRLVLILSPRSFDSQRVFR